MTNRLLSEKIAKIDQIIKSFIELIPEGDEVQPTKIIEKIFTTTIKLNPYPEFTLSTSISSLNQDLIEEFPTDSEQWIRFLNSNTSECICLSLTHGDEYVIAGYSDHTVRIWNIQTKKLEATLIGHFELVSSVHVTSENKYIISGSWDKTVRVWSLKEKSLIFSFFGHANVVTAVSSVENSNYAVSISLDESFRVWDIANKAQKYVIEYGKTLTSLFIKESGAYFLGSDDGFIIISDVYEDGMDPIVIKVSENKLNTIAYYEHKESEYLAIGSEDTNIYIQDIHNIKFTKTLQGHIKRVTSLCANSPNGVIVSASSDLTIKVWDINKFVLSYSTGVSFCPLNISFSDVCKLFIAGDCIYCWEDLKGESCYTLTLSNWFYYTTILHSFDKSYVVYSNYRSIFVWNLLQGKLEKQFDLENIKLLAISDDNELLISGGDQLIVRRLDGKLSIQPQIPLNEITCAAISTDKSLFVFGSENKHIYLWDFTENLINSFIIQRPIKSLAIAYDKKKIFFCTDELKIKILNAATGEIEVECLLEIDIEPKGIFITRDTLFCMICFDMHYSPRFISVQSQKEVSDPDEIKDLVVKYREFFFQRRTYFMNK